MKKLIIGGVLLCVTILGFIAYRENVAVEMKKYGCHKESISSETQMSFDQETELTLHYDSKVKEGNLTMVLKDENGQVIKAFKPNTKGKETIVLKENEICSIWIESPSFTGDYHIKAVK